MRKNTSPTCTAALLTLLCWSMPGQLLAADPDEDALQESIATFKEGENSVYAPRTIERAEAYLGAALMARQQQKIDDERAALNMGEQSVAEARQTAEGFRSRFSQLLDLRETATSIAKIIATSSQGASDRTSAQALADANKELQLAISTHEQGDLNQTQEHAAAAESGYRKLLDQSLPWLADLAENDIGKAANAGAKQFAPETYRTAKERVAALRNYIDGIDHTPPAHPAEALYLAQESKHLAQQVKVWRKDSGSHESMVLENRDFKLKLATILGMEIDQQNSMINNIPREKLLTAAKQLKTALADERSARKAERKEMKQQFEAELAKRLDEQRNELAQAQQSQMSDIREAFKVKLERETYEQKRQQRMHATFKQGEADIFVNLDGSLLIRLSALKFASGSSKINAKYYDMLGHLKSAIAIYADRTVRIEGHTDDQGDVKVNQALSLKRAESVRDFLISAGADGTHLKALGYGEVRPIASNEFEKGREMNRRIDVIIEAAATK
ncbi:OmpA family protein [Mariprofundus erugo]|uniref:OmpA family protein n=1 Tax=Mariprofundus erugo TaxID=2528639 RepID=A0A5R9GTQ3_9PROT|nr:OmpA family protein [Mariprofundus erugo]TLS67482.1 OmpA family protein [Mariprofundus erugo]